jgi:hypothetical protein
MFLIALLIAHTWLPIESHYQVCDNAIIQSNDWIETGYRAYYYSHLLRGYHFIPPYAGHVVALSGRKDVGYTAVNAGEVGSTCIYPSGFYFLVFLTFIYILGATYGNEVCRLNPSKDNFVRRIFLIKEVPKNDKSNNQPPCDENNNQVPCDNSVYNIDYRVICLSLCAFIVTFVIMMIIISLRR